MAEWKKIVVSGSDISQLVNDSGYLSGSQNIASSSVAARSTTLSADATASFALVAGTARAADSASVAARATLLSDLATASFADVAGTARNADSASVAARATTLSADATASFADLASDARTATSASIAQVATLARSGDGLFSGSFSGSFQGDGAGLTGLPGTLTVDGDTGTQDVDLIADDLQLLGTANEIETAVTKVGNDVKVTLGLPSSIAVTSSVATRANALSPLATASFADLASDARTATSASIATTAGTASVADRATLLSNLATSSFADLASDARTSDSASVAARATLLSADATASYADLAGTVHDGNITNAKIADTTIANAKLVNDSVTLGTTEATLGTTITSIVGLENISAATGTFVYQIFESSSTIITSGSNIFGNDENDIQQFTGSILQTGSMVISGSLDVAVGTISGSFRGDGSGLTGLATNLTVDGDTGTQDVSLIDDDLQVLGTANKITTAITKVGTDVKVTLNLTDTVEVTASVATRANTLAPTATASFADLASDARTSDSASVAARATLLSNLATASFADVAGTARNSNSASNAVNAISASAIVAGAAFPTTQGLEGQGLALNSSKDFIFGDFFGTGSTKKLDQSSAATTWSFAHNLNEVYPIVQAYDTSGDQLIPERVESINANNIKLYFAQSTAGVAAAMVGGMGISASQATIAGTASVAIRATTLSADATASFADLASDARTATSASIATTAGTASVAARATLLSNLATASFADLASNARTADSASVAARATLLSPLATASFADSATTSSHALGGAGTFSGSFLGDGSGLTGLPGTLTLDGDTGTQDVDLIADDLQIIGTAQEISTAVTKVGTDVKLTIALPDIVTIGDALTVTGNTTVGGNLIVAGAIVSASSLAVADQFIILASGSNGAIDGGIIINQIDDDPDGKGKAFAYDSSANRWAIESNLNDSASVITPDAYMGVIQEGSAAPSSIPLYGGTNGLGTIFVDGTADEVYIYV